VVVVLDLVLVLVRPTPRGPRELQQVVRGADDLLPRGSPRADHAVQGIGTYKVTGPGVAPVRMMSDDMQVQHIVER
jgi:hypothetical protein